MRPQPETFDALDSEDAVHPRILGERGTSLVLADRVHDKHDMLPADLAYWPPERDPVLTITVLASRQSRVMCIVGANGVLGRHKL
jgi:hypothetical protein